MFVSEMKNPRRTTQQLKYLQNLTNKTDLKYLFLIQSECFEAETDKKVFQYFSSHRTLNIKSLMFLM